MEITSATNFLVHLIRLGKPTISEYQLCKFRDALNQLFCSKYYTHWWPEKPLKGSSYRCIRIDKTINPLILQAGQICGFSAEFLYNTFPKQLTLWIDPHEVSYRLKGTVSRKLTIYVHFLKNSPFKDLPTAHKIGIFLKGPLTERIKNFNVFKHSI